jgi:glycosyltransferase involved in cell wall biosynthesis
VLCEDKGYFLWVASLDWGWEEKGLHIFVELAKRNPQHKFLAYGHAQAHLNVLERLKAETEGLTNFVHGSALIRGQEHTDAFCGARAFFMPTQPSIGESFGLTVIEALSKGVPVIASTAGAPAELLGVPGRHGIVEVGAACATIDEYQLALERFSQPRTPELSARIMAYAKERYSERIVVDKMLGMTLELLAGLEWCEDFLPQGGGGERAAQSGEGAPPLEGGGAAI